MILVTEVRIKLMSDVAEERLRAFASVGFDNAFVVRDLKIIEGTKGLFVAMPSRKLTGRCPAPNCGGKNHLRARFCNDCGGKLHLDPTAAADGRQKLHADIAHPVCAGARNSLQAIIVAAYTRELALAQCPGYSCRYDDYDSAATTPDDILFMPASHLRLVV